MFEAMPASLAQVVLVAPASINQSLGGSVYTAGPG